MIRLIQCHDGSVDLHVDHDTAGYLTSALGTARPRGNVEAVTPKHVIRVHVHGAAADPVPVHKPIEAR